MKNKIGAVTQPGKVEFYEKELPLINEDEVLIKVVASAICGSDIHIYKGKHPSVNLPATIGHEFSGIIEQVGNKSKFNIGDRVTLEPCIICNECEECRHGNYSFCENISFTYRIGNGSMANYVIAKTAHVFKLPDDLSFEEGCLIEPMSVAMHAVRRADVKIGDSVAVIGCGAIGLLVIAISKLCGASEIIATDFSLEKLKLAKEFGATHTVLGPNEVLKDKVDEITCGKGLDKSFECVGKQETFMQAVTSIRKNGLATIIGIFEDNKISMPATELVTREIKIQGAQSYCWDFPISIKMSKDVDLKKLITHEFKLDDLQKALDTAIDPKSNSIKVIIKP